MNAAIAIPHGLVPVLLGIFPVAVIVPIELITLYSSPVAPEPVGGKNRIYPVPAVMPAAKVGYIPAMINSLICVIGPFVEMVGAIPVPEAVLPTLSSLEAKFETSNKRISEYVTFEPNVAVTVVLPVPVIGQRQISDLLTTDAVLCAFCTQVPTFALPDMAVDVLVEELVQAPAPAQYPKRAINVSPFVTANVGLLAQVFCPVPSLQ